MPSRDIVEAFAQRLEAGDFIGAIEQFYTPDAATYENNAAPTVGRDNLVAKERAVLAASREVRATRIGPSMIEGDHVATRWIFSLPMPKAPSERSTRSCGRPGRPTSWSRNASSTIRSSSDAEQDCPYRYSMTTAMPTSGARN